MLLSLSFCSQVITNRFPHLSDSLTLSIWDKFNIYTVATVTKSLPELAGKRLTLSYKGATDEDENFISQVIELNTNTFPAYLINVKPEIKLEGETIASSNQPIGFATDHSLQINITEADGTTDLITHYIKAGENVAIVLDFGNMSFEYLRHRYASQKTALELLKNVSIDKMVGESLHQVGIGYWVELDNISKETANMQKIMYTHLPSEGIVSSLIKSENIFMTPYTCSYIGYGIDIKRDVSVAISKDGNRENSKNFFLQTGIYSSFWEAAILEQRIGLPMGNGISTARVMIIANIQGIPIYTIDSNNINTILPKLQHNQIVIEDVRNAIYRGKTVTIPEREISHEGWVGSGYIIFNPNTGDGIYRISEGMNGGFIVDDCSSNSFYGFCIAAAAPSLPITPPIIITLGVIIQIFIISVIIIAVSLAIIAYLGPYCNCKSTLILRIIKKDIIEVKSSPR